MSARDGGRIKARVDVAVNLDVCQKVPLHLGHRPRSVVDRLLLPVGQLGRKAEDLGRQRDRRLVLPNILGELTLVGRLRVVVLDQRTELGQAAAGQLALQRLDLPARNHSAVLGDRVRART